MKRRESQDYTCGRVGDDARLFPPLPPDEARTDLSHLVGRSPRLLNEPQTRWTVAAIIRHCEWLTAHSPSAVSRVLHQLGIHWKRSQDHVHSPDPAYLLKQAAIQTAISVHGASEVVCFLDEVSIYRQPTAAPVYALAGPTQPRAERSHASDCALRMLATLDATTGRVIWCQRRKLSVATFVTFFTDLVAAYPAATHFTVVLDNWPVHFHPDLLVALKPQTTPFAFPRPGHWPTEPSPQAQRKWGHLQLPISLLPLPTYASWLNPIEKLWRWLRQTVTHRHPWADQLPLLSAEIGRFLDTFAGPSPDLLRYCGLPLPK